MQRRNTVPPSLTVIDRRLVQSVMSDTDGSHSRGSGLRSDCSETCWVDRLMEAEKEGAEEEVRHPVEMEPTVGTMEDDICSGSTLLQFADGVTRDIRRLFRGAECIYDGAWSSRCPEERVLQGEDHCEGQGSYHGQSQCRGQIRIRCEGRWQGEGQSQGHLVCSEIWASQEHELRQGQCPTEDEIQDLFRVNLQRQNGSRCSGQGDGRPPEEENGQHPGQFPATKYVCERCRNLGPMEELFKVIEESDRDFWNTESRGLSQVAPLSHPGIPMSLRPLPASFWHQPSAVQTPIGILSSSLWYPTVTSGNPSQAVRLV